MLCPFKKETIYHTTLGGTVTSTEENFMDCMEEECAAYKKILSLFNDKYYYECGLTNTRLRETRITPSNEFIGNLP